MCILVTLSEVLQNCIRVLTILLLGVFLFTAVQGALLAKEIRDTVHTRLANNEFPLPTQGITLGAQESGGGGSSGQWSSSTKGATSGPLADADVARQVGRTQPACPGNTPECDKQLGLLCDLLKQKGFSAVAQTCDSTLSAFRKGDTLVTAQQFEKLGSELGIK
jgi:hypothetical protein